MEAMTANINFVKLSALFPLTPALSPWERVKRSQLLSEARAGFCSTTFVIYKNVQRLFPLPEGEGRGEGKRERISPGELAMVLRSLLKIYEAAK